MDDLSYIYMLFIYFFDAFFLYHDILLVGDDWTCVQTRMKNKRKLCEEYTADAIVKFRCWVFVFPIFQWASWKMVQVSRKRFEIYQGSFLKLLLSRRINGDVVFLFFFYPNWICGKHFRTKEFIFSKLKVWIDSNG